MTKYNWGIIGTGWIAGEMADALKRVNGEVYAAANPHKEALEAFGQEKGIEHLYTDPDKMINDPDVDIVYIATPHNFHYQYAKQALLAGKHVFCEKAITINEKQLEDLASLAKEKNLILTEGLTEFKNISINIQVNINDYILVLQPKPEDFFRLFHEEMPCALSYTHLH